MKKIAIIGTSPVSMLKAYLKARNNSQVEITLFDSYTKVGGAWYSDLSPKKNEIECGCHIWSYSPLSYRFIKNELGIPLFPFKTSPKFIGRAFKVPYGFKKTIDSYSFFVKLILKGKLNFKKYLRANPSMSPRIFGKKNLYPKLGSPELTNSLKEKLDKLPNVNFRLGFKINKVDIQDSVILYGDQDLEFDQVLLTSVSEIKEIKFKEEKFNLKTTRKDYIHILLESDKPFLQIASYLRFINDYVVHRIADVSYQTGDQEYLMLIGVKDTVFYEQGEESIFSYCKDFLVDNKLVNQDFNLSHIKTHIFPTYYIDAKDRNKINNLNRQQIELFHTTDMMYGIHLLLDEKDFVH